MGLFRRRKETLNEQLLREAGVDPAQALGESPAPAPFEPPRSLLARVGVPDAAGVSPKEWDATAVLEAPELAGERVEFTTIPDGDVIVGEETGDADVSPLADAVERHVSPPYRAVAQVPFPHGDKLELSRHGDDEELRVDGEASDESVPRELERVGEAAGDSYYVEADRIDGDLWEVRVTAF